MLSQEGVDEGPEGLKLISDIIREKLGITMTVLMEPTLPTRWLKKGTNRISRLARPSGGAQDKVDALLICKTLGLGACI
ncbi:hypothetical protein AAFF_G00244330 [Aldrovandia affinis]|uniref:Uncharacterized protein n=1 Tax=Aldrovandia affinis TaxID=143900 RepID=A0AAD7RDU7_9TELE|nr:hypothetical protein AAFF_G00244330 [Aldrovandia affinis]